MLAGTPRKTRTKREKKPLSPSDPDTSAPAGKAGRKNDRRCIASGVSLSAHDPAIRFVAGPDGALVPDLAEKLPGRGAWVSANRHLLVTALKKGAFSRAFRRQMPAIADPEAFADGLEDGLKTRALEALGLARRAGAVVIGYEKTRASIQKGTASVYMYASDAGTDGVEKISQAAGPAQARQGLAVLSPFPGIDLDRALGEANVVHLGVTVPGMAARLRREVARYEAFTSAAKGASDPSQGVKKGE